MAKASSRQVAGSSEHLLRFFRLLDEAWKRNQAIDGRSTAALAASAQLHPRTVKGYFPVPEGGRRTRPHEWEKLHGVLLQMRYFAAGRPGDAASRLLDEIRHAWERSAPAGSGPPGPAASAGAVAQEDEPLPAPDQPLDAAAQRVLAACVQRDVSEVPAFIAHRYAMLRLGRIGSDETDLHANFMRLVLQPLAGVGESEGAPAVCFEDLGTMLRRDAGGARLAEPECIWQLRGEPGAGKSTLLLDLELRQAHAACEAWRADAGTRPEVCVRVPLANMPAPADAAAVGDWVQARWGDIVRPLRDAGQAPPSLERLQQRARVRFLMDGLNEMDAAAGHRRRAMNALCAWSTAQIAAGRPGPVFTVRRLNHVFFPQGAELALTKVADVEPWSGHHIRRYCELRFPGPGNGLWRAIDGHPQRQDLLQLFGNPFNLALQCALYRQQGARGPVAASRADLMGRIALHRLAAALQRDDAALNGAGLVHRDEVPGDDERVSEGVSAQPSVALHRVALRGRLLPLLERVALSQHVQRRGGWAIWAEDETIAGCAPGEWVPALSAAAALQMARTSAVLAACGGGHAAQWQFSHQLWQEYLAACALARGGRAWNGLSLAPPDGTPAAEAWELPQPEPVFLDQAVQLAVQMAPREAASSMLEQVMAQNLALAARAALGRHLDGVAPPVLGVLRSALLARSTSPTEPRPEVRVEAGLLLGSLGDDIRFEDGRSCDGRPYRIPRPPGWIAIPAGTHRMEAPQATSGVPGGAELRVGPNLFIAFAPVTNAEFSRFVEDGGYGGIGDPAPPAWWEGVHPQRWWRGETRNDSSREWWEHLRRHWGQPHWSEVRASCLSNWRDEDIERVIEPMMRCARSDFDAAVAERCAPRRLRLPDGWTTVPRLHNPLQPVVGVCLWEALAYCRWLSARTEGQDWRYRLPSEAEWAVAARAGGMRAPGWPECVPELREGGSRNDLHVRLRRTSPIGCFPASSTPEGLVDLAGQVWEWTSSPWAAAAPGPDAPQEPLDTGHAQARVARGGSWDCPPADCHVDARRRFQPLSREDDLGFRLVRYPGA